MLSWFTRRRTLTVGVSCALHVALVAVLLLGEHWLLSALAAKQPMLAIELVTLGEPPPPEPPPRKTPPPKPSPPRVLRPPKPIESPAPQTTEAVTEPPPPEPTPVTPEPPAPPAKTAASEPAPPARPAAAPGPASPSVAAPPPPPSPGEGIAIGRSAVAPPPPAPSVASAPSRDGGSTGAITQYARPQGGYQVRPGYPSSARRLGIQGTTLLKVHVMIDGRVGEVVVHESAGHPDLDQAAADAVRRWRFEPARRGNDPIAMWVLLPVEFRLR
jgi:protein TonB